MGGMHGYGRVPIEIDEPLFHEAWEGRVWAMWSAIGATTVDRFRFTIEQMPPPRIWPPVTTSAGYGRSSAWRPSRAC